MQGIVALHGGQVAVASGEEVGSVFTITQPHDAGAAPTAVAQDDDARAASQAGVPTSSEAGKSDQ